MTKDPRCSKMIQVFPTIVTLIAPEIRLSRSCLKRGAKDAFNGFYTWMSVLEVGGETPWQKKNKKQYN